VSLQHVPVAPISPARILSLLDARQAAEFERTIERGQALMGSRVIWNVNSTARGGGVAEMLASLLAYTRGAGLDARWVVIGANPDFFRTTKRIHNMLHGSPGDGLGLGSSDETVFRDTSAANAEALGELVMPGDIVLLHDPQTAGLTLPLRERGVHVVWRCHIGIDEPNGLAHAAWEFLRPYVEPAEAVVFSREAYVWEGLDRSRVRVIPPSIDAFSAKNQELDPDVARSIRRVAGLEPGPAAGAPVFSRRDGTPGRVDRSAERSGTLPLPDDVPAVVQVSRWDRLKDPIGIVDAFRDAIAPRSPAHLVLVGPSTAAVADDPEGRDVLAEVERRRAACDDGVRDRIHLFSLPMDDAEENAAIVNALQRRADVAVQKSLAEGFGLTVSEAMWKARPVVASRVGGIQEQIVDGDSGVLVDPLDLDAFAAAVVDQIADPGAARAMGLRAREQVREQFLGPSHLRRYLDLFEELLAAP
jgi:trehalose synthase